MSNKRTTWDRVQTNPSLHPDSVDSAEGERIRWHSPEAPHSSQVVCVSAFGALRRATAKDSVLDRLFSQFPFDSKDEWQIDLEREQPELLNECGDRNCQSTSIDVLFTNAKTVICLEAKFKVDAQKGFGECSQVPIQCDGFYGPGSDLKTKTQAWCRLEVWDGNRSPRLYWTLGRSFFQKHVFSEQKSGEDCYFKGHNYQLMRNFLFAAALAQKTGKSQFGVMAIAPQKFLPNLQSQIDGFKESVLLREHHERIQLTTYERYVELLRESGNAAAKQLGDFLETRCLPLAG
jgi:hypothetical protein